MLKKQAPGETILKVGGMLLLFLGVLLAFGSGNNLSLVMKGSSDSAVVEYLNQNGMTYSQLVASNVMVLVAGVIYLAVEILLRSIDRHSQPLHDFFPGANGFTGNHLN